MALSKLTKVQTLGIGSNIEVVGVITTGQFKSGTSNLHSSGVELTNLNVSGIATIGGNVSIGGTLTYQDVTNIDSVGLITARSGINVSGGTATFAGDLSIADKIIHTGDTNTAIRFPAVDTITAETAGTERLRITSTGEVKIMNTSGTVGLYFQSSSGAVSNFRAIGTNNQSLGYFFGNSERVRFSSDGKVSIGGFNPSVAGLSISNSSTNRGFEFDTGSGFDSTSCIRAYDRPTTAYKSLGLTGSDIRFGINDVEKARIDSSGNFNLGLTASPVSSSTEQGVYLAGANSTQSVISSDVTPVVINRVGTGGNDRNCIEFRNNGVLRGTIGAIGGSNGIFFQSATSEAFRITSTGQLLLGETSAFDSNVAIQFRKDNAGNQSRFIFRNRGNNGSSRVRLIMSTLNRAANGDIFSGMEKYQSGGMAIFNGETDNAHSGMGFFTGNWEPLRLKNGNVSGTDAVHIKAYWGTSNGLQMEVGGPQSGTHKAIRFQTSHYGGERGYIGVTLGGTSYNSSSDYRMKQDVVDMTGAIDRVKSFKPRRFKWKEDPTYTVDGFLAHEASTVVPESVVGEKDAVDSNGDPEYQVMDNSKLVPVLTAALKEAIAKIETLETKVAALEGS